jgi:hypothetical protein
MQFSTTLRLQNRKKNEQLRAARLAEAKQPEKDIQKVNENA